MSGIDLYPWYELADLPEIIVNLVTAGHNDYHERLHALLNAGPVGGVFPAGPPASGTGTGKDKAAVQAAWNAASDTDTGGDVVLGPGTYQVGDLRLTTPASGSKLVWISGAGEEATVLIFEGDGAAGEFAFNTAGLGVHARNLTVKGPGSSFTVGTAPANLRCFELGSRAHLVNVRMEGFYCGYQMVGDHITVSHCKAGNNYIGEYHADATTNGDNTTIDTDLSGNMRASIAVAPSGSIDGHTYVRGHLGYSPFPLEFEEGGSPGWTAMSDSMFLGTAWEYAGNAHIYCGDKAAAAYNVDFLGCRPFTYNAAFKISSIAVLEDVYTGTVDSFRLRGDGFTRWNCVAIRGCSWDGWKVAFLRNVSAGTAMFTGNMGFGGITGTFDLRHGNARAVALNPLSAVTAGQVVEYSGAPHYVQPHNPLTANGGSMIAGVALNSATVLTDVVIVAIEDLEAQPIQVVGSGYGANDMLFAVGSGQAANKANAGTGYASLPIVGRVSNPTISGGKVTALVKVTDRAA